MINKNINKKNNAKLFLIIIIIAIFTITVNKNILNINKEKIGYKDDFYDDINKPIIENIKLEDNESYYSEFSTKTQEIVDDKVSNIIKEEIKNNKLIAKVYNSAMNLENQDSINILDKYIKLIDNSKNIKEYINNIVKVNKDLSMGLLINFTIENDYKDNTKNIINIYPTAYDFGNIYSDYYINPLYYPYVSNYISFDRKILQTYGYSEQKAKDIIKDISKMYNNIAKDSKKIVDIKDIKSNYNIVSKEELNNIYTNIDILEFIKEFGIYEDYNISIVDVNQANKINNLLKNDNLEVLKEYAKLQILQEYGQYANKEYYDLVKEMNDKLLGTETKEDKKEEFAEMIVQDYFISDISKQYFKENVNDKSIEEFTKIIHEILDLYKVRLKNNNWLTAETKNNTINKLNNIKINIGEPETWDDYSKNYIVGDNLLENVINMNKEKVNYIINAKKENKDIQVLSQLVVNAFYSPIDNSINFPAALLEYKYCKEGTYYQKLGSIGMIIAHEISHAFDFNGSKFDEKGNLNNWWKKEDAEAYEKLKEEVIKYYDGYKINKKSVFGLRTVNENIADLGGLSCVVELAQNNKATKEQFKELFEAYANLWASKSTEEFQKMLMMTDEHSPDKVRVNAILSSIDKFYEVYDINEEDKMFVKKEDRIKVW